MAEDSEVNADGFVGQLFEMFDALASQPGIGFRRPYMPEGMRAFPHRKYLIFYTVSGEHIEIGRVLHGSRDIEHVIETDD
ncbi:type II toxin-antitoxin system RelE/ParE family toxin [Minwuia sp.]|uniref:type II toxin-antitoxin system RelE/ParE family toxin n=1 Tax=Minwuia sp. TaxID=2493630 RepID=UPI003A906ED4